MHPLFVPTVHPEVGATPLPARLAVSAPASGPSDTFRVADFLPAGGIGPNFTSMVQLSAAPSVVVPETQPLLAPEAAENSPALGPVTEKETGPVGDVPLFVTVDVKLAVRRRPPGPFGWCHGGSRAVGPVGRVAGDCEQPCAGWCGPLARWDHKREVAGSNTAPAPEETTGQRAYGRSPKSEAAPNFCP